MPMNAPWLSERYPVKPVMTFSPLAPMASTSARIIVFCAEMLGDNGNSTITIAAMPTMTRVASFSSRGSSSRASGDLVVERVSVGVLMRRRPL